MLMEVKCEWNQNENQAQGLRKTPGNAPMTQKTVYIRQKVDRKEPTRLTGSNGNSYEVRGMVSQPVRKTIAIVNKNSSNNYQSTPRIVAASTSNTQNPPQQSQGQPVYATLNTVRQGNESQPIRTGPIRLSIPKTTATGRVMTTNRTYQSGNVLTQPIRVQLRQPIQTNNQTNNQKTIIHTVQMPRTQQTAQRNARYATIKQNAIIGTTDNGRRVIQSRNANYQTNNTQYEETHGQEYYQQPPAKKRQRETREDEGGPGYVKAKGTWYRARKCHKCDKTFPWASSLRRHLMTHTGLKPYCCAACKAQFTTKSNLERHVLRRHGVLDKEGQAKYIVKLSQSDLQRQLEEENEDLNSELFGEQDDRRNKVVNRNTQRRAMVANQHPQPQEVQFQDDTKYVKFEYQPEKEIIYDIQDTQTVIGSQGEIEYHEEPIEYHEQPPLQPGDIQYDEAPVQQLENVENSQYEHYEDAVYKAEPFEEQYEQYDQHGNPITHTDHPQYEQEQHYENGDEITTAQYDDQHGQTLHPQDEIHHDQEYQEQEYQQPSEYQQERRRIENRAHHPNDQQDIHQDQQDHHPDHHHDHHQTHHDQHDEIDQTQQLEHSHPQELQGAEYEEYQENLQIDERHQTQEEYVQPQGSEQDQHLDEQYHQEQHHEEYEQQYEQVPDEEQHYQQEHEDQYHEGQDESQLDSRQEVHAQNQPLQAEYQAEFQT